MFKTFLQLLCCLSILAGSIFYWFGPSYRTSIFAIPLVFLLLILYINSSSPKLSAFFLPCLFYLLFSAIICSIHIGDYINPLRFLFILFLFIVPSCLLTSNSSRFVYKYLRTFPKIVIYSSLPMAIFILFLQFSIFLGLFDPELFRQGLMKSQENLGANMGIIYKHSYSPFYHIQIVGFYTPFPAFILSLLFLAKRNFRYIIPSIILLLAIFSSLNTALIIATLLSIIVFCIFGPLRIPRQISFILSLVLIGSFVFSIYDLLIVKFTSEISSVSLRSDMINQIFLNLTSNPFRLFFGSGVGSFLNVSNNFRDYTSEYYYEIMTLYIFLQLGVVGFVLLFMPYVGCLSRIWHLDRVLLLYLACYVLGSFFNPFLFNSVAPIYFMSFLPFICDSGYFSSSPLDV